MGRVTYKMIYEQFLDVTKIDRDVIEDYRPCNEEIYPHCYIPNAIIIWPISGGKIIYIYQNEVVE